MMNVPDEYGKDYTVEIAVYDFEHLGSKIEEAKRLTMRHLQPLLTDGNRYAVQIDVLPPEGWEIDRLREFPPLPFQELPKVRVRTHVSAVSVERYRPVLLWEHVDPMGEFYAPGSINVMSIDRDGPYKKAVLQLKGDAEKVLKNVCEFFDGLAAKRDADVDMFCGRE